MRVVAMQPLALLLHSSGFVSQPHKRAYWVVWESVCSEKTVKLRRQTVTCPGSDTCTVEQTVTVPGAYPGCAVQPLGLLGRPCLAPALWGGMWASLSSNPLWAPEPQPESIQCFLGYGAQGFK